MKTEPNDMAFPDGNIGPLCKGMTKRELMAMSLVQGLADTGGTVAVKRAIKIADELIKELNKQTQETA